MSRARTIADYSPGVTVADLWRLTADANAGTNADVTANLAQASDSSSGFIGTGMTESSGVFTFPSTGVWLINITACFDHNGSADVNSQLAIDVSSDSGSTYDEVALARGGVETTSRQFSMSSGVALVDVTSASTFRVKFRTSSFDANTTLKGSSTANITSFTFIRLGDT